MHQQPAPLTFPCMPAPNMLGRRFTVMMMPGRVPDHVYGGTAFLASPTVPSPPQSRGFSLPRGEARPKGRYPGYPAKRGRKTSILRNWKLFLIKSFVLRPAGGIVSAPSQDRFTPCPLAPSARPLLNTTSDTIVAQEWYKGGTREVNLQWVVQERNQGGAILTPAWGEFFFVASNWNASKKKLHLLLSGGLVSCYFLFVSSSSLIVCHHKCS